MISRYNKEVVVIGAGGSGLSLAAYQAGKIFSARTSIVEVGGISPGALSMVNLEVGEVSAKKLIIAARPELSQSPTTLQEVRTYQIKLNPRTSVVNRVTATNRPDGWYRQFEKRDNRKEFN